MDDILAAQFERVEKALGSLVDSIAAYNPSPQAAIDLVLADDELSQGLDQLSKHRANYARIKALRSEADSLEEQLKSSVQKLATLRHELFETPATTFPSTSRKVPFDELLQYANNISKYTVPPTYRELVPDAGADKENNDARSVGAPTNGVNTPAAAAAAAAAPETTEQPKATTDGEQNGTTVDAGAAEISAEESEWLKKLKDSQIAWYPWPSTDKIRLGNLYKLQYYKEKHYNLDDFDIPAHEEKERQRELGIEPDEVKEEEEKPQEQQQQQQQQQRQREQVPVPVAVARPPKPRQEAFTGFDDMDDI